MSVLACMSVLVVCVSVSTAIPAEPARIATTRITALTVPTPIGTIPIGPIPAIEPILTGTIHTGTIHTGTILTAPIPVIEPIHTGMTRIDIAINIGIPIPMVAIAIDPIVVSRATSHEAVEAVVD